MKDSNRVPVEIPTSNLFATHENLADSIHYARELLLATVKDEDSIYVYTALQCLLNTLGEKYDVYLKDTE